MEFRFDADERNNDGIKDIRNSYLGLKSQQLGTLTIGNFDSVYFEAVSSLFDVYENDGFISLDSGSTSSRGDTVAYASPAFNGLQGHVQVKHISGNDAPVGARDNSSTTSTAAAVTYSWEDLYLAAGYNQSRGVSERARPMVAVATTPPARISGASPPSTSSCRTSRPGSCTRSWAP